MNSDALDLSILGPAFVAGLLVIATHVPLGRQVLARGIVFIDLAIAQIAGLGVIAADAFGWEPQGWATQAAAAGAALAGAALLTWTDRRWPQIQEALIGVLFVLAACVGILLLSNNPHGGEHLKDLLVGQILWVLPGDLLRTGALYAVVLGLWFGLASRLGRLGFYVLFAITVTASVQLVGVYLVFATLIIPALVVRSDQGGFALTLAYGLSILGYAVGLVLSAWLDLPTGAVIVCALAMLGLISALRIPMLNSGARVNASQVGRHPLPGDSHDRG